MATYTFAGNSGSAGKTTTVVSEAVLLAERGLTVRVIDLDSQANASTWLGHPSAEGSTTADILRGNADIADAERPARLCLYVDHESGEPIYDADHNIANLTVVPAFRKTLDPLVVELGSQGIAAVLRLQDALSAAAPVDVTLIDCPGSLNVLATIGLAAAAADSQHGLITCIKPSGKEIEGLPDLIMELNNTNRILKEDIELVSVVPCAVPPQGSVYEEQLLSLSDELGDILAPTVRRRTIVDESYTNYTPAPLYTHRSRKDIVADYNAVIDHQIGTGLFNRGLRVA